MVNNWLHNRKFDRCNAGRGAHDSSGTPLLVIAGNDYGMGSSRDWAAKGTNLLGVKAVIAASYERDTEELERRVDDGSPKGGSDTKKYTCCQ